MTTQTYPQNLASAGISTPKTQFIQTVEWSPHGLLTVIGDERQIGAPVTLTFQVTEQNAQIIWTCKATEGAQFAPSNCRETEPHS